jgi:signal transduction histidine kinase
MPVDPALPDPAASPGSSVPADPIRVLLIDDSPEDSEIVEIYLRRFPGQDFAIRTAATLADGLRQLAEYPIDVVVLDLHLPDSVGLDTLTTARSRYPGTPIVVISGAVDATFRSTILALGADDALGKSEPRDHLFGRSLLYATERHRAMAHGRSIAALLAADPDATVVLDSADHVLFANQAAADLLGRSAEDLCGSTLSIPLPQEPQAEIEFDTGGRRRTGDVRVVPVRWRDQPARMAAIRDTTERKLLDERLAVAQQLESLGRLAGGVAHDFNNLLAVIIGSLELAMTHLPESAAETSLIGEAHRAALSAAGLTEKLLAFGRRGPSSRGTLRLGPVVTATISMLRRLIAEDIDLVCDLDPDPCLVDAETAGLEQIVVNLVLNARDAVEPGGRIEVATRRLHESDQTGTHDWVRLTVTDDGRGMSDDVRARIFEPFYTTRSRGRGTGLGLSTVYGTVTQLGGRIDVLSTLGRGSTFMVRLPAAAGPDPAAPALPTDPAATAPAPRRPDRTPPSDDPSDRSDRSDPSDPSGRSAVLLVEDEQAIRRIVRLALESEGYQVLEAADGPSALALAAGPARIDLLLTDVVMPGMNGFTLAAMLAQVRPGIITVFMSGYPADPAGQERMPDPDHFLAKPFTPAALTARLRTLLTRTG